MPGDRFLLGDAAHPMTPDLGQGACLAIEDAVVIARCLAGGAGIERGLRAHEAARLPRTARLVNEAWLGGRMMRLTHPLTCCLRDRMIQASAPFLPRRFESMLRFPG